MSDVLFYLLFQPVAEMICFVADYSASKAALINLHESLRYELDKRYKFSYIFKYVPDFSQDTRHLAFGQL